MGHLLHFKVNPVPKGRPRFTRSGRAYTPKKTKDFESTIKQLAAKQYKQRPMLGPLEVNFDIYVLKPKSVNRPYPSVKPDFDNLIKAICDGLNEIVWKDDAQIVKGSFSINYGEPLITVGINEL